MACAASPYRQLRILALHAQQMMLDSDLAQLSGVETRVLITPPEPHKVTAALFI